MSKKAYDLRGIYSQMEVDLVASMKRNLKRHENDEKKEGFEWDQWQEKKLQDLKQYRVEASRIVRKAAPVIESTVDQEVKGAFRRGADKVSGFFRRLVNKVLPGRQDKLDVDGVSDDNFFKANEHRINALASAAQGELRAANQAILRQTDDVFRQTIFKSQVYMNSGAASLNQAIDMATKDFLEKGLDCITYKDGRRVNVASYSEMVLRTSSQRAVFAGEGAKRQELGITTVMVSAHSNCSDLCLPWQGKVYIDDVYSGGKASDGPYPLLSTAMDNGLFHPNCRHNMTTYVKGQSRLPEPVDDTKALASYKQEQRQRYMERQVRKYKRRAAGSLDEVNQAKAEAKVKQWQGALRGHIKANPELRRDYSREKIRIPPS
ncbi:phage minor capsid protein [Paenibacillus donghaensis]|uniref:Capsid protein n=1 Tax=Paenibacillus donghaensis TaxID=414771 RepID=A0A2Z2K9X3_9BACL|nr:phage minor capsid protein [Paenibacillus donghaensis]ASA22324.1 capsid protein [Paenibacillus donghaensis]